EVGLVVVPLAHVWRRVRAVDLELDLHGLPLRNREAVRAVVIGPPAPEEPAARTGGVIHIHEDAADAGPRDFVDHRAVDEDEWSERRVDLGVAGECPRRRRLELIL